jgi:hypothetical protein
MGREEWGDLGKLPRERFNTEDTERRTQRAQRRKDPKGALPPPENLRQREEILWRSIVGAHPSHKAKTRRMGHPKVPLKMPLENWD